jgi:hypothetical protein
MNIETGADVRAFSGGFDAFQRRSGAFGQAVQHFACEKAWSYY